MNSQAPALKKIGANIKRIRIEKGIKQEYVATKLGVTKSAISRIENGDRDTTLKNVLQIADVLDEAAVEFFG